MTMAAAGRVVEKDVEGAGAVAVAETLVLAKDQGEDQQEEGDEEELRTRLRMIRHIDRRKTCPANSRVVTRLFVRRRRRVVTWHVKRCVA